MQRLRSKSKIAIECEIAFLEIRLFLENHSLEFNEIWHENTLGITGVMKKLNFTKKILDIPVNLVQGIIKELSVKLLST